MTLPLNPPPVSIPAAFTQDGEITGFFDQLLRTIYLLWSEVQGQEFAQKTLTTDATPTALQTIAVPTDRTVLILSRVVARRTGGSAGSTGDSAGYILQGTFKNISNVVTQVGSGVKDADEDQAGWDAGYSISGANVSVAAVGAANNNITWESFVTVYEVGV